MTPDELASLRAHGTVRRYRKGATIFLTGERSDHAIWSLSGRTKASTYTEDGREIVLAVREGGWLGELSAIDGEPRSATLVAIDEVEAIVVPAESFRAFLAEQPAVAISLLRELSGRLRDADRKRIEFGSYDTIGRVARRILELADRFGEAENGTIRIGLPFSQDELAGWTGSSREAVAKALRTLRERGWISTSRREIVVVDLDALRRRASP